MEQLSIGRVFVDASIAIAVGDKQLARGRDRQVRGQAERIAVVKPLLARRPNRHDQPAILIKFPHAVGLAFGTPYVVLVVDKETVRVLQNVLAPRIEKVSIPIKDHQWVLAARVDIDIVFGITGHRRNPTKAPAGGQFPPTDLNLICILPRAKRHGILLSQRATNSSSDSASLPNRRLARAGPNLIRTHPLIVTCIIGQLAVEWCQYSLVVIPPWIESLTSLDADRY